MGKLTNDELAVLRFEGQGWPSAGRKIDSIRDVLGMTEVRYYQVLNSLIDREEALADSPMLVGRLRRLRSAPPSRDQ